MNSQCTRCSGAHKLADCPWPLLPESEDMPTPHKHAELIKAWADGAKIELFSSGEWNYISGPMWDSRHEYRIKPEPPAREYPLSNMPWNKILEVLSGASLFSTVKIEREQARALVDAAIRHAIDHDQVVPMAEVQEVARNLAKKDRDARDMAVAQAVLLTCLQNTSIQFGGSGLVVEQPDLASVIASIKG